MIDSEQDRLEHSIRNESRTAATTLHEMELEKLNLPEEQKPVQPSTFMDRFKRMILGDLTAERRSTDFIERSDGTVTKRKKSHTGRGVEPRYLPGEKAAIKGTKKRREAEDFAAKQAIYEGLRGDNHSQEEFSDEYGVLFAYLDQKRTALQLDMAEKMLITERNDRLQVLRILSKLAVTDAAKVVLEKGGKGAYTLRKRLNFYQKLIQGKATRKETQYNYQKEEYEEVAVPIPAGNANRDNIELGLLRDILYAEMVGSPELAAVKIATNRINEKIEAETSLESDSYGRGRRYPKDKIRSVVQLSGYHSGIFHGNPGQYVDLIELYKECFEEAQRVLANREVTDEELEHRAVLIAAKRLEDAFEYSGIIDTSESPYNPSFNETIAVGRLGERVRRQMSGMRHKIEKTDLHNVERFVGKSGNNKHEAEHRTLKREIEFLEEGYAGQKQQEFTKQHNRSDEQKQQLRYERITEKLTAKLEKARDQIESLELPDEERALQLQSVNQRHQQQMDSLDQEYHAEIARLRARTPEELLADLKKRQELVNQRYERRKSLAQRALDLHFHFNHHGKEKFYRPYAHMVDWINDAPFGTIKRSHNMLQKGVSEQTVIELALSEIILGSDEISRENLAFIHKWVERAKVNQGDEWWKLIMVSKVKSVLRQFHYDLPLSEVLTIADQLKAVQSRFDYNKENLRNALSLFTLEEVRKLLSEGYNLYDVVIVKRIVDQAGYQVSAAAVAEMSRQQTEGLGDALDVFGLASVRDFLSKNIHLRAATAVLRNTRQQGHELTLTQIANIAKRVNPYRIDDFVEALANLPMNQVEELYSVGVSFNAFQGVQQALKQHQYPATFSQSLKIAQKLLRIHGLGNLGKSLDVYSLEEVEYIIEGGVDPAATLGVRQVLEKKDIATDLDEIIQFTRFGGRYSQGMNVANAIHTFGIEDVRKIVSKACNLDKAVEVKKYLENNKKSQNSQDQEKDKLLDRLINQGGVDLIISLVKAGGIEIAMDTIEAGFTVEEITRFPFLISKLVRINLPEKS